MQVLMTILYILLFIVMLSILIIIHELGHFTTAKIFKVYVLEYSIGFGPALIHKKRKNGETYFSLRVIPFGGYVSMFGEETELEEGVVIDESRSLEGIKKWKRAIILVAGVTMNALLALHLFFISNVAFKNEICYYGMMTIKEDSKAYASGLRTLDILALDNQISNVSDNYGDDLHLIDNQSVVTYEDGTTAENVYAYLDLSSFKNFKNLVISKFMSFYEGKEDNKANFSKKIDLGANFKSVSVTFKTVKYLEETDEKGNQKFEIINHDPVVIEKNAEGALEDFGYQLYLHVEKPLSFGKAIVQSFKDFGRASTLIIKAFGTMFTKETWNSMGGIVAIGFQSTSVLQNFGWGKFLYLWGALSVNLAIVNLFPFPGLDGWQLLVLAVEAATRKKIPNKVKTIVSIVGLVILFAFMGVLLFKDLFVYVFKL